MIVVICDKCGKIMDDSEFKKHLHSDSTITQAQDDFYFCGECFSEMVNRKRELRERFVKDTDNV